MRNPTQAQEVQRLWALCNYTTSPGQTWGCRGRDQGGVKGAGWGGRVKGVAVFTSQNGQVGYVHGPWFLTPSGEDSRIHLSPVFLCPFPWALWLRFRIVCPSNPPQVPSLSGVSLPLSSSTSELRPPVPGPSLSPDPPGSGHTKVLSWGFYSPTLALTRCVRLQTAA